jgi:hypothetical protein
MTIKTVTLAEFLLARIAETERKARSWQRLRAGAWVEVQGSLGMCQEWREVGSSQWRPLTDEAREKIYEPVPPDPFIMAECEAKRRIVDAYQHAVEYEAQFPNPDAAEAYIYEHVIQVLALPYAAHEDFREEWRP